MGSVDSPPVSSKPFEGSCTVYEISAPMLHLQLFRGDPSAWFSDCELARMWRVEPATVRYWRFVARKNGHAPKPGQMREIRKNAMRRWVEIRSDYANLLEAIFKGKTIKL